MTYLPQFDPDRPTTRAEDFDNGVEGAAEDAYTPFGDMRLALETALQAVVRTD